MISRNHAQFFWTFLFGNSCESLASDCRHGIAADWNRFDTHQEFLKSIMRYTLQFRGNPKLAAAQAQFISEAASMKSPQLSATFRAEKFPSARLCWLRSRVFLTKPALRTGNTHFGRTAMFHSAAVRICR